MIVESINDASSMVVQLRLMNNVSLIAYVFTPVDSS